MSLIARVTSWLRVSRRRADFEREMQDEMQDPPRALSGGSAAAGRAGRGSAPACIRRVRQRRRAQGGMPRRRRPAAGRRAARRRQLRIPAAPTVAGVHAGGAAVSRARDRGQHGDLQPDRHGAGPRRCQSTTRTACSSSTTPAGSPAAPAARRIPASSCSAITTGSSRASRRSPHGRSKCRSTGCRSRCAVNTHLAPTSTCSVFAPPTDEC